MTSPTYWRRVALLAPARLGAYAVFSIGFLFLDWLRLGVLIERTTPDLFFRMAQASGFVVVGPLLFVTLVMTEALALRGARHLLVSLAAVIAASAAGMVLVVWLHRGEWASTLVRANLIVSEAAGIARQVWVFAAASALLTIYFAMLAREAELTKAARAADIERARSERATMAAQLKVAQARVEPELLFGVLAGVRDLYGRDRAAADALLDDLIAYLRAALPHMRVESSTLAREAALAQAYARVLLPGRMGRGTTRVEVDEALHGIAFPPMLLQPLVRDALSSGAIDVALVASAGLDPQADVVEVEARPRAQWDDERLADLRQLVRTCLGPDATLEVAQGPSASVARIRLPRLRAIPVAES